MVGSRKERQLWVMSCVVERRDGHAYAARGQYWGEALLALAETWYPARVVRLRVQRWLRGVFGMDHSHRLE